MRRLLIILILIYAMSLFSEAYICGTASDLVSGTGIPGVRITVTVDSLLYIAYSDTLGNFCTESFSGVAGLVFHKENYQDFIIDSLNVQDEPVNITVSMIPIALNSSLSGFVYENGNIAVPVADVNVIVSSAGNYYSTISDSTGFYFLQLMNGNYNLIAAKDGYHNYEITGINLSNSNRLINIPLEKLSNNNNFEIWPGDTNFDGVVDERDIVAIGTYWGYSGTSRLHQGYLWSANSYPNGWSIPEAALADCNGNGVVEISDVLALNINWNKQHSNSTFAVQPQNHYLYENFQEIYNSLGEGEIDLRIKKYIKENILSNPGGFIVKTIYPNPFRIGNSSRNETLSIDLSNLSNSNIELELFNLKGQMVKKKSIKGIEEKSGKIRLDMQNLNTGIFLLKISDNHKTITKKIILIK
ncbi:MAG: carboxypeptidase regulatory-like domain-containing protein [Candidatus Cloacimonetes bacterium]|nr:carboxypeptidase regulatory-like domain-containing protein [Candidatus Cloacimonadota bacterium]